MLTSRGHTSRLQQDVTSGIFAHQSAAHSCQALLGTSRAEVPGPGEEAQRGLAPDPHPIS